MTKDVTASLPQDGEGGDVAGRPDAGAPRWWNTLRVRFGILLALALLPWLLLTALGAYGSVERNRLSQTRTSDLVSTSAVTEIRLILESGRLALDAAPELIGERGCEAGTQSILDRVRVYEALIVNDASGEVVCQNPAALGAITLSDADPFSADRPFRIEQARFARADGVAAQDVAVLQRQARSGEIYTLVLREDLGMGELLVATLGEGAALALNKADGRPILSRNTPAQGMDKIRTEVEPDRIAMYEYDTMQGEERRAAITYFEELGVYATVARSARGRLSALINPYTSVLLPIFAWVVGFGLIWLGTQTMLLTPLAKVRGAARNYAQGRMGSRVALSGSAAGEVRGLANTLNRMATELQDRNARIADNLDEKDTLLREIHHRVKNNLQIIISLLNMQERKAGSAEAVAAIAETRSRINAIAVVHRGLYESPDLRSINVAPFVTRLLSSTGDSLALRERGITLSEDVAPCVLTADNAIPVALFIVEAVSNAAEHGVADGGKVHVAITRPAPGEMRIEVSDNGCGVVDTSAMGGIGTRLMKGFARQLSGELSFADAGPGLRACLSVPIDEALEPGDAAEPFQVSRRHR